MWNNPKSWHSSFHTLDETSQVCHQWPCSHILQLPGKTSGGTDGSQDDTKRVVVSPISLSHTHTHTHTHTDIVHTLLTIAWTVHFEHCNMETLWHLHTNIHGPNDEWCCLSINSYSHLVSVQVSCFVKPSETQRQESCHVHKAVLNKWTQNVIQTSTYSVSLYVCLHLRALSFSGVFFMP